MRFSLHMLLLRYALQVFRALEKIGGVFVVRQRDIASSSEEIGDFLQLNGMFIADTTLNRSRR
jgi:hypothetical protein